MCNAIVENIVLLSNCFFTNVFISKSNWPPQFFVSRVLVCIWYSNVEQITTKKWFRMESKKKVQTSGQFAVATLRAKNILFLFCVWFNQIQRFFARFVCLAKKQQFCFVIIDVNYTEVWFLLIYDAITEWIVPSKM
jgi:hypothetical protein